MPTLDDLHAVLHDRERHAGDPDTILAALENPPSRRHIVAPLLAASAVVTLAAGALYVAQSDDPATTPPAGGPSASPHPLNWSFTVGAVDGFVIDRVAADSSSDLAKAVSTAADGPKAFVTAYAPGVVPKGDLPPIADTVHGHDAFFAGGAPPVDTVDTSMDSAWNDPDHFARLRWRDDSGSWVQVEGTLGYDPHTATYDNAEALHLAERIAAAVDVTPGADDPVTMPFALHDVPDGLQPFAANLGPSARCIYYSQDLATAQLGDPDLTVCRSPDTAPGPQGYTEGGRGLGQVLGDGTRLDLVVAPDRNDELSFGDLQALADGADVSPSLDDTGTWLPVR